MVRSLDLSPTSIRDTLNAFLQPSEFASFNEDSQQELPESEVISSGPASYQSPHPAVEVDTETDSADQQQDFPLNDASLGELLEMLSEQYKMKPSQSEQTRKSRGGHTHTIQNI